MSVTRRYTLWMSMGAASLMVCAVAQTGPGGARNVVEKLDRFVQPRFEKVDGQFGMSRIVTMPGHAAANLIAVTEPEKALVREANASGHAYQVHFLHIPHATGTAPARSAAVSRLTASSFTRPSRDESATSLYRLAEGPTPPTRRPPLRMAMRAKAEILAKGAARMKAEMQAKGRKLDEQRHREEAMFKAAADAELQHLKQGKARERTVNGWLVSLRPVRATQAACVSCHTGSKLGDTLGVMVYAVREEKGPASGAKRSAASSGTPGRKG